MTAFMGLVGIIAMIMILFSPFNRLWKNYKKEKADRLKKEFAKDYLHTHGMDSRPLSDDEISDAARGMLLSQPTGLSLSLGECRILILHNTQD